MPVHQPLYNSRSTGTYESITTSNGRGLTPALWRGIDVASLDPGKGFFYLNDFFENPDAGSIVLTQKTAGTAAITSEANGVLEVDAASATDDQGANLQFKGLGFTPSAGQIVAYETRVRLDDIGDGNASSGGNYAFGLCNLDTSFLASGAPDTSGNGVTDYAMFLSISSATTWNTAKYLSFQMTKAGSGGDVDLQQDLVLVVDGDIDSTAWVKVGFRAEVGKSLELYVNGELVSSTSILPTIFPDTTVYPTFVCESEGVDSILNVDWFAVGVAG